MYVQAHNIEESKPLIVFLDAFTALTRAYMLVIETAFVS